MKSQVLSRLVVLIALGLPVIPTPAQNATNARGPKPANTEFEPVGGISNNVSNPLWGSAGTDLLREGPTAYADGISSPSLPFDLSARAISDFINNQAIPTNTSQDIQTVDQNSMSDFGYSFGQFMDHDIDLTLDNGASYPILVAVGDPIGGLNDTPLAFNRSIWDPATGTSIANPAQDLNTISSYFDLSQIYGSDVPTSDALRTFENGLMKTSPGGLPPLCDSNYFTADQLAALNASVGGMANGGPLAYANLYATGDSRGNENVELTVLQALFLDNHNLIASELQKLNPSWTDQELFDEARKLNIAQYQSIVYNEWIPAALGNNALPRYSGYNPTVNATIANEFSTVAFRFGHSLLSGNVERQGNDGQPVAASVPLAVDFFDSYILNGQGQPQTVDPITGLQTTDIGAVLKGDADGNAQAMDVLTINEVRDLLFNEVVPGVGAGQDLIALDIERGRDHGIPDYNTLRVALGLPKIASFAQITRNVQVQHELQQAYPGGVDTIDAFEGGLAEDHVPGSDVGPLFQKIMVNQFVRLREGDRFFYLNESFDAQEQEIFNKGNTLAKIIMANTDITNLQENVMLFRASISGTVSEVSGTRTSAQARGLAGVRVQLQDTTGDILATTETSGNGDYSFNQLSGPSNNPEYAPGVSATGIYQIVVIPPSGMKVVATPAPVTITRGDIDATNVNVSLLSLQTSAPTPVRPGHMNHDIRF